MPNKQIMRALQLTSATKQRRLQEWREVLLAIKKIDKKKKAELLAATEEMVRTIEAVEENREACRKRDANSIAAPTKNQGPVSQILERTEYVLYARTKTLNLC